MAIEVRILRAGDERILNNVAAGVFDHRVDDALRVEFMTPTLGNHLCVAIEDGAVVGFASAVHYVHPDKRPQLWINEVGVSPSYQGRGMRTGPALRPTEHRQQTRARREAVLLFLFFLVRSAGRTAPVVVAAGIARLAVPPVVACPINTAPTAVVSNAALARRTYPPVMAYTRIAPSAQAEARPLPTAGISGGAPTSCATANSPLRHAAADTRHLSWMTFFPLCGGRRCCEQAQRDGGTKSQHSLHWETPCV